ncbi:hypothetical protein MHZ95_13065 [Sporosarcina sp. ACRSM]|uniref:hypothetical protein n=1 Tax=Sporosarcina sp. ACRSM TaxID=2918216 RepID=UPI001EF613C3|nr:hypothetical protein [Sporosarcina sp. ACRSM]MCG7336195.1 hypothetical protein [Sporosarcina sp. ACRSM]
MERKSKQSYNVKKDDLIRLGVTVEKLCNALIKNEYGEYSIDKDDMFILPALLIIDGMQEWQEWHNIGLRINVIGEGYDKFEIYNLKEQQDKIDKAIMNLNF